MPAKIGDRQRTRLLLLAVAVLLTCVVPRLAVAQGDLSVQVSLDADSIGLDQQAVLAVTISGATQSLPSVQMPPLPAFEVYSQGRSSNISIVNGQVNASIVYRYLLLPQKPGTYGITGITVTDPNGKAYRGNPVTLTVVNRGQGTSPRLEQRATTEDGATKDYFLDAVVDKKSPYVGEQVTLTLKFYIGVQFFSSPELSEPSTTGFWTETIGNSAPYFQKVNGRNYRVIERKYALFPTQTGQLTIGRAEIQTTVASRRRRNDPFDMFGDLFPQGEQVTIRSQPITISAKSLPEAGKPADFTGTVGQFTLATHPDKTEVEMNQPITVSYKITGSGNVKSIAEPTIPPLDDFRVYRASTNESVDHTEDRLGGTRTFEEVFIPKRPGMLEIPAIRFTYFDPTKNRYETITTKPIGVTARKPEGYAASPDVPYSAPNLTIGSETQDIRYIKDNPGVLRPRGQLVLFSPLYLIANGLPVALLVGLVVMRRRREMLASNVGLARSRAASAMARKRLAKARSLARPATARDFYAELSLAVTAYMADKLNISPHGLTSDQIADLLRGHQASDELISDTLNLLRQCDFARFAPATLTQADLRKSLADAESIMIRMEGIKFV